MLMQMNQSQIYPQVYDELMCTNKIYIYRKEHLFNIAEIVLAALSF